MVFRSLCEALQQSERFINYCPSVIVLAEYIAVQSLLTEIKSYTIQDWQKLYLTLEPELQRHFFLVCWDIANEPSYCGDELIAMAILSPQEKEEALAEAA